MAKKAKAKAKAAKAIVKKNGGSAHPTAPKKSEGNALDFGHAGGGPNGFSDYHGNSL